jgi:hypothetical protein
MKSSVRSSPNSRCSTYVFSPASRLTRWFTPRMYAGPTSVLVLADERIVRQESLQTCPRPITHRAASYRPCCERLRPATEVWR